MAAHLGASRIFPQPAGVRAIQPDWNFTKVEAKTRYCSDPSLQQHASTPDFKERPAGSCPPAVQFQHAKSNIASGGSAVALFRRLDALVDRMVELDRRHFARLVAGKAERAGHRLAEQGVAERPEDELERLLLQRPFGFVMPFGELVDQAVDRLEDRIERVVIAGEGYSACPRAPP